MRSRLLSHTLCLLLGLLFLDKQEGHMQLKANHHVSIDTQCRPLMLAQKIFDVIIIHILMVFVFLLSLVASSTGVARTVCTLHRP